LVLIFYLTLLNNKSTVDYKDNKFNYSFRFVLDNSTNKTQRQEYCNMSKHRD
jgi:hypothetical protein